MTALTNIQMNKPDFSIDSIMRKENMPRIRDPKAAAAAPLVMPVPTVPAGRYYSPVYPRPLCEPAYFLPTAEAIQAAFPWYRPRFTGLHRFAAGPDFSGYLLPPFRKAKRIRTAFSASQLMKLESAFDKNHYVTGNERKQLAQNLGLTETQVKVWFQNRRTKEKRQVIDERGDKNQTIHVDKMESQNQRLSPTPDQSVSPIRISSSPSLCVSDDISFNGESGKEEEIA